MDARSFPTVLSICAALAMSGSGRAAEIALTAFEPFGGVPVNNSAEVMKRLAAKLRDAGVDEVVECVLPVEYDRAAKIALGCIGAREPELVLSLGAGGCEIHYETRGHNRDDTGSADNAGVLRNRNTEIVPGGPEYLELNAPMSEIFRRAARHGSPGRISSDAGAYVCNNTAYWLAKVFTKPGSATQYGFIHVPPTTCSAKIADAGRIAETIFEGVRGAMPELF